MEKGDPNDVAYDLMNTLAGTTFSDRPMGELDGAVWVLHWGLGYKTINKTLIEYRLKGADRYVSVQH